MDTNNHASEAVGGDRPDGPEQLEDRLAWEAKCIAEAQTSIDAGNVVPWDDVRIWLDSLDTAHPLPEPRPHR